MDEENSEEGNVVEEDYYTFLNLPRTATQEEIVSSYRRLSRLYHPDKHSDPERKTEAETLFNRTKKAYEVLSDAHRRAIYDSLGERGLQTEGWELVQRTRTPQEIRDEYERIARENEERRLQQRTNPKGQLTVNINCTDWFNSYEVDDPEYTEEFRVPEISGVSISQSVEAPLTLTDTTTLSGQASTANGTGNGNVALAWRRLLGPRGWIETEFAAGNGPSLSLRAFRTVTKHVFSNATLTLQATPKGIAPGLNTTLAMQMSKHTMGSLVWRAGLASSMSVSLTRDTSHMHFVSMLQFGIPHSFAFIAYTHKMEHGKLRIGLRAGTFGMQVEYGAEKKISKHSAVSATMAVGIPMGVSLKMRVVRANYTFSFPIHLSEELVPAAIFYGTVIPTVAWLLTKTLVIDPYVARQKAKDKERQKEVNRSRVAEKQREAAAAVNLMRATFARVRQEEETRQGLVLLEAFYGPVPNNNSSEILSSNQGSPTTPPSSPHDSPLENIEVTIQLQCLVQDSKLTLHEASKSQLPGFFDPAVGEDKKLFVKYLFRGQLHEVTIGDLEALRIPRTKSVFTMHSNVVVFKSDDGGHSDPFIEDLKEAGFRVTSIAALTFVFLNNADIVSKMKQPDKYSGLILTSKRCVENLEQSLTTHDSLEIIEAWSKKLILCTGPATKQAINEKLNIEATICVPNRVEGIVQYLKKVRTELSGPVLYPCGEMADNLDHLSSSLRKYDIISENVPIYSTVQHPDIKSSLENAVDNLVTGEDMIFCFFSPSGFKATMEAMLHIPKAQKILPTLKFVALGPTTARAIVEAGHKVWSLAKSPTPQGLSDAIKLAQSNASSNSSNKLDFTRISGDN